MKPPTPLIDVTIYVWGDNLNPEAVSSCLGIEPSLSRRKGEKRTTKTHQEITAKTSVWTFSTETKAEDLSAHIRELAYKLDTRARQINSIAGVEGAYIDIHVVISTGSDGEGQFNFRLNQQDVSALHKISLPVEFTLNVGMD